MRTAISHFAETTGPEPAPEPPHAPRAAQSLKARLSSAAASRGAMAIADQAVVSAAAFLTTVLVGRSGDAEQLGVFALGTTIMLAVLGVQEALISTPFTVFGCRLPGTRLAHYAGSLLVHSGLLALITLLMLATATGLTAHFAAASGLAPVLLVLTFTAAGVLLRDFLRRYGFARLEVASSLTLDVGIALVQVIGLLLLYWGGYLNAALAHAAIGVASGVCALVWLARRRREFQPERQQVVPEMARNWQFGRWLLAGHLVGLSQAYAIHWLLALLLDTAATGSLAAAMTIVQLSNPLMIGIGNILAPQIAHGYAAGGAPEVRRVVGQSTLYLTLAMALFCGGVWLLGAPLLGLLYGGKYVDQTWTLNLLALATLAGAAGAACDHGLRVMQQTSATLRANLVGLAVTVAATLWLAPLLGIQGAAGALLAGNVAATLVRGWAFRLAMRDATPAETSP